MRAAGRRKVGSRAARDIVFQGAARARVTPDLCPNMFQRKRRPAQLFGATCGGGNWWPPPSAPRAAPAGQRHAFAARAARGGSSALCRGVVTGLAAHIKLQLPCGASCASWWGSVAEAAKRAICSGMKRRTPPCVTGRKNSVSLTVKWRVKRRDLRPSNSVASKVSLISITRSQSSSSLTTFTFPPTGTDLSNAMAAGSFALR
mmetsp:Transcript_41266/g.114914  ORF Transcript_41266/g.114914 Transcript_41266/m.114914 type:complete len:203 (+) Transcript_41266:155-763(+)